MQRFATRFLFILVCTQLSAQYRYLRLNVTAAINDPKVELYDVVWVQDTNRYDATPWWQAPTPANLDLDLGAGNAAMPDKIILRTCWTLNMAPRTFNLYGSNDQSTWTLLDSRTNLSTAHYTGTDAETEFLISSGGPQPNTNPWTAVGNYVYTTQAQNNVGIGTSSPSEKFEVAGTLKASKMQSTGELWGQDLYSTRYAILHGVDVGAWLNVPNGWVGIGTNQPVSRLHIIGDQTLNGNFSLTGNLFQNGQQINLGAVNNWQITNNYNTYSGNVNVQGQLKLGTSSLYLTGSNAASGQNANEIYSGSAPLYINSNNTDPAAIPQQNTIINRYNGKVGIGTEVFDVWDKFKIQGNTRIEGNLVLNGNLDIIGSNSFLKLGALVLQDFTTFSYTQSVDNAGNVTAQINIIPRSFLFGNIYFDEVTQRYKSIYDRFYFDLNGNRIGNVGGGLNGVKLNAADGTIEFYNVPPGSGSNRSFTEAEINNARNMVISHNGRVGINIAANISPAYTLDVNGTIKGSGLIIPTNAGAGKYLASDANGNATWQVLPIPVNNWLLDAQNKLYYNTSVYVGPRRPTSGPHANFKMSVDGKLVVQSIYVIPTTDAAWADDVFSKNYRLPSLQETEKYIATYGHLQGIPSAKEVAENGIDVGTMDEKLLRKLEELYLHVIRLEKENEALKKALLK